MGDIGDMWRGYKQQMKDESKDRREANLERGLQILRDNRIKYDSKSETHFVIQHAGVVVDYWPTTGKWIRRDTKKAKRGIAPLIRELKSLKQ